MYSLEPGVYCSGKVANEQLLQMIREVFTGKFTHVVIEMVASYGKTVGKSIFQTCVWIGRFVEAAGLPVKYVYRKEIVSCLCGTGRATDSIVRQAIMDLFGRDRSVIGTKKQPGPLYGFKKDMWAAMAVWLYANTRAAESAAWLTENPFWEREVPQS
jgi:hypothetical protein